MSIEQAIKINMLLIEDESRWISVFKDIVKNDENISFQSARSSGLALELVNDRKEINLVVVDYELGINELPGDNLIRLIKAKRPDISIICWSAYAPIPSKIKLIEEAGAIGFMSKGITDDKTVLDALKGARQNNKFFSKLAQNDVIGNFTPMQQTILEQLAEGKDYEAIAKLLLEKDYRDTKNRGDNVGTFEEYLNSFKERSKFLTKDPDLEPEKNSWLRLLPSPIKNPNKGKSSESSDEEKLGKNRLNRLDGKKKVVENHILDIKDRIANLLIIEREKITLTFLIHFAFDYFSSPKRKFSPEKILGIIFLRCHLDEKPREKIAELYSIDLDSIEKYLSECKKDILKKVENGEKISRIAIELDLDDAKLGEMIIKWRDEDRQ